MAGKININFHAVAHHNMVFSDVFLPEKPMLVLQTLIVLLRILTVYYKSSTYYICFLYFF